MVHEPVEVAETVPAPGVAVPSREGDCVSESVPVAAPELEGLTEGLTEAEGDGEAAPEAE